MDQPVAVTNSGTRHVAVTASAIASLSDFSNGRLRVAFGTGDSSVKLLGLEPTRHQQTRGQAGILGHHLPARRLSSRALRQIRERASRLRHPPADPAPIYIAASGPKSQQEQGPEIFARVTRHVTTSTGRAAK
jgi:5,10-methylenetetrahydromethanopterin reductase